MFCCKFKELFRFSVYQIKHKRLVIFPYSYKSKAAQATNLPKNLLFSGIYNEGSVCILIVNKNKRPARRHRRVFTSRRWDKKKSILIPKPGI